MSNQCLDGFCPIVTEDEEDEKTGLVFFEYPDQSNDNE